VLWCINEWLYPALLEAKQATISPYIIEWGGVKVLSVEKKGRRSLSEASGGEVLAACLAPHSCRVDGRGRRADGGDRAIPRARGRQDDVSHLRALLAGLHAACGKGSGSATLAL